MFLLLTGLIIYLINYLIGWLLYFKIITMKTKVHQIFFSAIIIILLMNILFLEGKQVYFCLASLVCMIALPFGRKGGIYHQALSTTGLILYCSIFIVEN
ncbi:MAG: hypothetical protein SGI89_04350 [bacterium]|nr:hypothetical protein [bacterium]